MQKTQHMEKLILVVYDREKFERRQCKQDDCQDYGYDNHRISAKNWTGNHLKFLCQTQSRRRILAMSENSYTAQ